MRNLIDCSMIAVATRQSQNLPLTDALEEDKTEKLVFEIFLRAPLHGDFGLPVDETKSFVQMCTTDVAARCSRCSESFEACPEKKFLAELWLSVNFQIFI